MRQALHIFKKDVTHLWPQIAVVLLLAASLGLVEIRSNPENPSLDAQLRLLEVVLEALVPAAYAWLIVTVVYQEAVPGTRQFWVTRPYRAGSLFAAKMLFVLLFVCVTMVAKDCFVVAVRGFPVVDYLPGLLLRLTAWTAWVVVPALAAGAVTRNLQEAGMAGAGIAMVYALQSVLVHKTPSPPTLDWVGEWMRVLLLLILGTAIVLWQNFRRETGRARVGLAVSSLIVLVGVPLLPWNAAFAIQMLAGRSDVGGLRLTPALPGTTSKISDLDRSPGPVAIGLPVRLSGVRAGMVLVVDGMRVAILSGGRELWHSGWAPGWFQASTEEYRSQMFYLDERVYRSMSDQLVTVKIWLALTLMENGPTIYVPAHQATFTVEGSRCENRFPNDYPPAIWCFAAIKAQPETMVGLELQGSPKYINQAGNPSYAPYEAIVDQSPVSANPLLVGMFDTERVNWREAWSRPDAELVVTAQRPVAHLRRELVFRDVRLAQYLRPPVRAELRVFSIPDNGQRP